MESNFTLIYVHAKKGRVGSLKETLLVPDPDEWLYLSVVPTSPKHG